MPGLLLWPQPCGIRLADVLFRVPNVRKSTNWTEGDLVEISFRFENMKPFQGRIAYSQSDGLAKFDTGGLLEYRILSVRRASAHHSRSYSNFLNETVPTRGPVPVASWVAACGLWKAPERLV